MMESDTAKNLPSNQDSQMLKESVRMKNHVFLRVSEVTLGLPRWLNGEKKKKKKKSACQCRRHRFNPWVRKILWSRKWQPISSNNGNPILQYSCLENPMDRGVRQATVHGVTKSQTQLGN